jgi:hypothetical protein
LKAIVDFALVKIRRAEYLFGMPSKNDIYFSVASCKKDIIFGGHPPQNIRPFFIS